MDTSADNGGGSIQANLASNNSAFILQFCPYPQGFTNCINVTPVTTGATASVNINFNFPEKGTFSGAFQIVDGNGTQSEITATGTSGANFKSALLPAATITGGIGQTTGNSPGFGSAAMNAATAHIMLSGAFPNHTFNTAVCPLSSQVPCTVLSNITTDAQGNASADVGTVPLQGGSIFRVSDSNGVQFVTAFRVQ